MPDPGLSSALFWSWGLLYPLFTNAFEQHGSGLVIRVLGDQLAAEGLGEDGLGELVDKLFCLFVPRLDLIGLFEKRLDPADDFLLFGERGKGKLI